MVLKHILLYLTLCDNPAHSHSRLLLATEMSGLTRFHCTRIQHVICLWYIHVDRLTELRRDLQAKIGTMTKTNINIGPAIENFGGETFLSQEVTISLLQEAKNAFKRCQVVSGFVLAVMAGISMMVVRLWS